MSTFSGLSTALSALYASRRAVEVAGQNVANANTEGYTRQRVDLAPKAGPTVPAIFSRWSGTGLGVDVQGIARIRDEFLEARAQTEHSLEERLGTLQQLHTHVEDILGEPSDTGLQAAMTAFWTGWDDVANHPTDPAARGQLLQRAGTLADRFHATGTALATLWGTSADRVDALTAEVNTAAANVATYNGAIRNAVESGLSPNELLDERDKLVLRLGELVGATARPTESGMVDVHVGGTALVHGLEAERLTVDRVPGLADVAARPPGVSLRWAADGYPVEVTGGEVGGLLAATTELLPGFSQRLDAIARQVATVANDGQGRGFGLDGNAGPPLFSGSTAVGLTVALDDPNRVAAAARPPSADPAGRPSLDGENALTLATAGSGPGAPDAAYRSLVVDLGVQTQSVKHRYGIQRNITEQADTARSAVSGVNLDEEMTNLVQLQHAYEGAARVISTVDAMLDTLINLGR